MVEHSLPYQDEERDIDITRQSVEEGTASYYWVMADFVKRTLTCSTPATIPEELCGIVLSRMLHYPVTVFDPEEESQPGSDFRRAVDAVSDDLLQWLYQNIHRPILKMPVLVDKVLHFNKPATSGDADKILLLHQEQVKHTRAFMEEVSLLLAVCHLAFTDRKMDLGFKMKKKRPERQMTIAEGVQLVANCSTILGEFIKLLLDVDYLEPTSPRIEVKYFSSIV